MNTAFSPEFDSNIHPANHEQSKARARRRIRVAVPLEPALQRLRGLLGGGSRLFALLKRVFLLVLGRVAQAFDVKLQHKGLDEDGRAEADFEGDPPAARQAARQAGLELSALVEKALELPLEHHAREMQDLGEGAEAYLSLSLDGIGEAIARTGKAWQQLQGETAALLASVGERLGVSPASLEELVRSGSESAARALGADPQAAELTEKFQQVERAGQQLVRLKLSFCDHCIAARQVDVDGRLASLANQKMALYGDASLRESVEFGLAQHPSGKQNEQNSGSFSGEMPLNSARPETTAAKAAEAGTKLTTGGLPAKGAALSRSQRFSGGPEDEPPPSHDWGECDTEEVSTVRRVQRE